MSGLCVPRQKTLSKTPGELNQDILAQFESTGPQSIQTDTLQPDTVSSIQLLLHPAAGLSAFLADSDTRSFLTTLSTNTDMDHMTLTLQVLREEFREVKYSLHSLTSRVDTMESSQISTDFLLFFPQVLVQEI